MAKEKTALEIATEYCEESKLHWSKEQSIRLLTLLIEGYGIQQQAKKSDEIFAQMGKMLEYKK